MDQHWRSRDQLSAILICPDREMANSFSGTLAEARTFQVMADLKSYPPQNTLDVRLRQMKPDVVLLDVASEPDQAAALIRFVAGFRPAVQLVALHHSNDSQAVVNTLRQGASEFLHAPFPIEMQHQAVARIRRLRPQEVEEEGDLGKVALFTSTKPGSGSSTLAAQTAYALARVTSKRVLLIDLDAEGGNIAFYLKLQPSYSVTDAIRQSDRLDACLWSSLVSQAGDVDVLSAPDLPDGEQIDQGRLHDLLEFSRILYDVIVVDAPCVFQRLSLQALTESDAALLITTGDLASLHQARKAINLLTQLGIGRERYRIVANRLGRRDGIGAADLEKILNTPVQATIPNDYFALHRVISLGQALPPEGELGRAMTALATQLTATLQQPGAPDKSAQPAVKN